MSWSVAPKVPLESSGKRPLVLILVPHYCVVDEKIDPTCDAETLLNGRLVREAIERDLGWETETVVAEQPRKICDLNRTGVCTLNSKIWKRIISDVARNPNFVIEVHSFQSSSDFNTDASAVVLYMGKYGGSVFEEMVARDTNAAYIRGGIQNAIGMWYEENYPGIHVLLEIRQRITNETRTTIVSGIVRALKKNISVTRR